MVRDEEESYLNLNCSWTPLLAESESESEEEREGDSEEGRERESEEGREGEGNLIWMIVVRSKL